MPEGTAGQSCAAGRIVTFYSFKGGTGHAMALANADFGGTLWDPAKCIKQIYYSQLLRP